MHKTTKKGYPQSVVYFKNELNKKNRIFKRSRQEYFHFNIFLSIFFYVRRLSETTSARRWDISQNNLVTQEKVIFLFYFIGNKFYTFWTNWNFFYPCLYYIYSGLTTI